MSTTGKKAGRPVGSVQTPHALLKMDLREQIRMNQRLRTLLGQAVDRLEKALAESDGAESPGLCLKIIETLGTGLSSQGKALDSTAKHVLANEEENGGAGEVDILKMLKGDL